MQSTQSLTDPLDEIERLQERCKMLARSVASIQLLLKDERTQLMHARIKLAADLNLTDPQGWYVRDMQFLLQRLEEISELNDATEAAAGTSSGQSVCGGTGQGCSSGNADEAATGCRPAASE